jgi:hypothetical protein
MASTRSAYRQVNRVIWRRFASSNSASPQVTRLSATGSIPGSSTKKMQLTNGYRALSEAYKIAALDERNKVSGLNQFGS